MPTHQNRAAYAPRYRRIVRRLVVTRDDHDDAHAEERRRCERVGVALARYYRAVCDGEIEEESTIARVLALRDALRRALRCGDGNRSAAE